jgi:hypothetical protein
MTVAEQLMAKGERKKMQEVLIQFLTQKFGIVSESDKIRITSTQDPDKLDGALSLILRSESIEEILRPLG